MERETLFLKVVVILIGIPILGLCIFGVPSIANEAAEHYPAYLLYPVLIGMYAAAVPFLFALYRTLKLLIYIDKNKAFSEVSIKALKDIKYCAVTISILYAGLIPLLFPMAQADDAPGIVALGLVITFASIVIAVFAAVLQKLLKNAIDIKSENDLTV
ncbi:DUF2975 domain-containing protein [Desulfoscipio sp. XC116]|uniref:DUF2975 domain-containing protein n=1 Tax=Desulfoscipio sp. XC116 TaxID=3144975 RepID=UPI00325B70DD